MNDTIEKKIKNSRGSGRKFIFNSKDELLKVGNEYLESCKKEKLIPTMSGLALAIGCHRSTLVNYSYRDEFKETIERFKLIVEENWERALLTGSSGVIFWMKNNANYSDKSIVENHNDNKLKVNVVLSEEESEDEEDDEI